MKKSLKKIILLGIIIFIFHQLIIIVDGIVDDDVSKINTMVVLGSKVNVDGSLSKRLKDRLDASLDIYAKNTIHTIFVSGGLGKEGHYEGTCMATYLIEKGVKKEHIVIDNKGNNTRLTALNFKNRFPTTKAVIIVSQYFHITRCKLAFQQLGIKKVAGIGSKKIELRDLYSSFREFFGFYKYLISYSFTKA